MKLYLVGLKNMTPGLAPKANELQEWLSSLKDGEDNTFYLKSIENDAKKLLNTQAGDAYVIIGVIEAYRGHLDGCITNFENAVANLNEAWVYKNYSVALAKLRQPQLAYEKIQKSLQLSPNSPSILYDAISLSFEIGCLTDVINNYEILEKLKAEKGMLDRIKTLYVSAKMMINKNINENDLSDFMTILNDVCRKNNTNIVKYENIIDPEGDGDSFFYYLGVNADLDKTLNMNDQLCIALAEKNLPITRAGRVMALFQPEN